MKKLPPVLLVVAGSVAGLAHAQPAPQIVAPAPAPAPTIVLPPGINTPPPTSFTKRATVEPPLVNVPVPPACPTPDLAKCQEPGYLRSACGGITHANLCKTLIQNDFSAKTQGASTPGATPIRGRFVKAEPVDYSDFDVSGMDTLAIGGAAKTQLKAVKPSAGGDSAGWTLLKAFWHANGNQVASCHEYAHEKLWTFSVFQDTAAPRASADYRGFYDAALRELEGKPLRSKDGGSTFTIDWPTNAPKNEYYRFVPATGRGYPDGQQTYAFNPNVIAWVANAPKHAVQDFAWHRRMSAALANVSDEELEAMYQRQLEYADLQTRREHAIWHYLIKIREINTSNETNDWKLMSRAQAAGEYGRLMRALDAQLETAIIQAKVDGCLEPNRATKCDWSPHLFSEIVEKSLLEQKQSAWKACMKWTKGDFRSGAHITQARSSGLQTSCEDCTVSTTKIDEYFQKLEAKLRAFEPVRYDAKTGKPVLGGTTGDVSKKGSSKFGAEARWAAGFEGKKLIGPESAWCEADVSNNASFETKLTVLGGSIPIVSSNMALSTKAAPSEKLHAEASLRVLGQDLMTPVNQDASTFHIAEGPERSTRQSASTYIVVIAVPLKLTAGASGAVGVDYAISGTARRQCAQRLASISGSTMVRPWLRFDAFASVSLDLLVAEAGVRATLTLLQVNLPFKSTLKLEPTGPQNKLTFVSDANMNLDLRTLDGKVVVFVEYLDREAQKTIVAWKGLHTTQQLFDFDRFSVPLDIANVAHSQR